MLRLFADSDSDMTPALAEKYGYGIFSMPYSIDGKTIYPYEDYEVFDSKPFYDMLRSGVVPGTSAINTEKYIRYIEPVFAAGDDILYVHFSAAMSMTFSNLDMALKELSVKYPERKFYKIDTKAVTVGSLIILEEIGDMYLEGKSVEEMMEWAKTEVDKFALYLFADDLKFFKKSGRVSGVTATMGTLLGVRPIIYINSDGKMVSIGKERGRAKAMERLLSYVEELGEDINKHRIIIAHTDAESIADEFEVMLTERFGSGLRIEKVLVNPTAGCHCGPNSMGVCFHAKHR